MSDDVLIRHGNIALNLRAQGVIWPGSQGGAFDMAANALPVQDWPAGFRWTGIPDFQANRFHGAAMSISTPEEGDSYTPYDWSVAAIQDSPDLDGFWEYGIAVPNQALVAGSNNFQWIRPLGFLDSSKAAGPVRDTNRIYLRRSDLPANAFVYGLACYIGFFNSSGSQNDVYTGISMSVRKAHKPADVLKEFVSV